MDYNLVTHRCVIDLTKLTFVIFIFCSSTSIHTKMGPTSSQKILLSKKRLSLTDHVGAVSQQVNNSLFDLYQ